MYFANISFKTHSTSCNNFLLFHFIKKVIHIIFFTIKNFFIIDKQERK
jgi:hypothetical protein